MFWCILVTHRWSTTCTHMHTHKNSLPTNHNHLLAQNQSPITLLEKCIQRQCMKFVKMIVTMKKVVVFEFGGIKPFHESLKFAPHNHQCLFPLLCIGQDTSLLYVVSVPTSYPVASPHCNFFAWWKYSHICNHDLQESIQNICDHEWSVHSQSDGELQHYQINPKIPSTIEWRDFCARPQPYCLNTIDLLPSIKPFNLVGLFQGFCILTRVHRDVSSILTSASAHPHPAMISHEQDSIDARSNEDHIIAQKRSVQHFTKNTRS